MLAATCINKLQKPLHNWQQQQRRTVPWYQTYQKRIQILWTKLQTWHDKWIEKMKKLQNYAKVYNN
eukprot:7027400-Ditylum_brightwellii.AAC.1